MAERNDIEHRHVDTAQGLIAYTVSGDPTGEPIVLLPGFQSSAYSWLDRGYLDLLDDFRTICVDPLGHGLSAKSHDDTDYTAELVVGHVTAVLDAERSDRAIVWGFSRGGVIAALCGELVPDRCAQVVMGGSPIGSATEFTHPALARGEPFLAAGDWDGYWGTYPVPLPQPLKDMFIEANDPKANAAAIRAMARWATEVPNHGLNPTGVATFAYFGAGEVFADALRSELTEHGVHFHEGAWPGHAETMIDAPGVVAAVRAALGRTPG